jgi:serine/threonine-protein kinase
MALVTRSSPQFSGEVEGLLRARLRVVTLITAVGFAAFLVKDWLQPQDVFEGVWLELTLHGFVVVVTAACAGLLWSRVPLCAPRLRLIELIVFGSAAAFFAWSQYAIFNHGIVFEDIKPDNRLLVVHLAAFATALRWALLIMMYGTFIPNTWRRCAVVVGVLCLLPLLTTAAGALPNPMLRPYLGAILLDLFFLLTLSSAVALFGSYKISALHQQAFEARKLGQYQLKQRLGVGGMGEVYLAEHTLLRRPCALKVIHPEHAGDPTSLVRFEREVRAMATLTHWNTVEIYDYGHAEDGTFFYVMEYLPGKTLETLVEQHGPLPPGRAVHFLRQVCYALREAHGIGLIHRDIKPGNIFACTRGGVADVAKLLDFGLVQSHQLDRQADKLTLQGTVVGSPAFISPEQASGKQDLDARCDIYSLGGVAYFLLTGQPPFVRETAMQMLLAHYSEQVTPLSQLRPDVPADLEAVVMRCLDKDPARRFPDATSLEKALAACACAGAWGEERATQWWREQVGKETQVEAAGETTPLERTAPFVPVASA